MLTILLYRGRYNEMLRAARARCDSVVCSRPDDKARFFYLSKKIVFSLTPRIYIYIYIYMPTCIYDYNDYSVITRYTLLQQVVRSPVADTLILLSVPPTPLLLAGVDRRRRRRRRHRRRRRRVFPRRADGRTDVRCVWGDPCNRWAESSG